MTKRSGNKTNRQKFTAHWFPYWSLDGPWCEFFSEKYFLGDFSPSTLGVVDFFWLSCSRAPCGGQAGGNVGVVRGIPQGEKGPIIFDLTVWIDQDQRWIFLNIF